MNTGTAAIAQTDVGTLASGAMQRVGDVYYAADGRRFKYVKYANASALAAGAHVYGVVTTTAALAIVTVANGQRATDLVAGSQKIVVSATAAVAADAYAGGYALITSGTNKYSVRVAGNTGTAAAGSITLLLSDPLRDGTALVPGTDTVTLSTNPSVASTTTATGNIDLGYTVTAVPAQTGGNAVYGYTQVAGYNAVTASVINVE